jgi:hypothetical protein
MTFVALLLAAAAAAPGVPKEQAEARKLVDDAHKLLKKKQVEPACQKLDQASRLLPDDASLLVELGACLHQLGLDDESQELGRRALANAKDRDTRKGAYAVLDGVDVKVELPDPGHCSNVPGADGSPAFFACAYEWSDYRNEEGASGSAVRLAVSQELAKEGMDSAPRPLPLEQSEEERPGARLGYVDLLVYENTEDMCKCDADDKACKKRCPVPQTTTCRLIHVAPPDVGWVCRTTSQGSVAVRSAEVQVAPEGRYAKPAPSARPPASGWAPAPKPAAPKRREAERIESYDDLPPLDAEPRR